MARSKLLIFIHLFFLLRFVSRDIIVVLGLIASYEGWLLLLQVNI